MGLALVKSKLHLDGKCISSIITAEEMKEYDVLPKHLDGIVSQLRVTKDVEVAVFLYQTDEENYKVSTRSASYVDRCKIRWWRACQGSRFFCDRRSGCTAE